jgi:hypothetical protein
MDKKQAIKYTCQNKLLAFSSLMNNKFTIKPHHKLIADALERVER